MSENDRRYYNFRFPKNGRFPTYMDLVSMYPYFPIYATIRMDMTDWEKEDLNLSDIDFYECLLSADRAKSYTTNVVGDEEYPMDLYVFNSDADVAMASATSAAVMDRNTNRYYALDDFIRPVTGNTMSLLLSSASLKIYNMCNVYLYRSRSQRAQKKAFSAYMGYPGHSGYSANRCYLCLRNPYDFDIDSRKDSESLTYDRSKLPTQDVHTAWTDERLDGYTMTLDVSSLTATGTHDISPAAVRVRAAGIYESGWSSEAVPLGPDYYIETSVADGSGVLAGLAITYMQGTEVTIDLDIAGLFPDIDFMERDYTLSVALGSMTAYVGADMPVLTLKIRRSKPYTSYRLKLYDQADAPVTSFNVLSSASVTPDPVRVRVYGSNDIVTDELVMPVSDKRVKFEVFSGALYRGAAKCTLERNGSDDCFATANLVSALSGSFSWHDITSARFGFYTVRDGADSLECMDTFAFNNTSVASAYYLSLIPSGDIPVTNRLTVGTESVDVSLYGLLSSGNRAPVISADHRIDVYILDVDGEQIGGAILDHRFNDSSTLTVNLVSLTSGAWNWFEAGCIVFRLTGPKLLSGEQTLCLNFTPVPDDTCDIEYTVTADVSSAEITAAGVISPDTVMFSVEYCVEGVLFPTGGLGLFIGVAVFAAHDDEIPVTEMKVPVEDDTATVRLSDIMDDYTGMSVIRASLYKSTSTGYDIIPGVSCSITLTEPAESAHADTAVETAEENEIEIL